MSTSFHEERRGGLGGSDMGAILGLNPYRTPFQVWQEKTGRAEPFTGNLQTRFGKYTEEFVAREYCERTGRRVQRYNAMLRHPEAPLIGHVDRLVVPDGAKRASYRSEIRTDRGLEAKTAHALAASRGDDWGEDGTDRVPSSYLIQCATYMALTGCEYWDLAALFGNSDFRIYHLHRDAGLEAMLIDEASRWWRDHVVADVPPDPQSEAEARQRWSRHVDGRVITLDGEAAAMLRQYAAKQAESRALEDRIQSLRDWIIPRLEDADAVFDADGKTKMATFRKNKDSQKTNWEAAFKDATQDVDAAVIEQFVKLHTKVVPGVRVLRLAKEMK